MQRLSSGKAGMRCRRRWRDGLNAIFADLCSFTKYIFAFLCSLAIKKYAISCNIEKFLVSLHPIFERSEYDDSRYSKPH